MGMMMAMMMAMMITANESKSIFGVRTHTYINKKNIHSYTNLVEANLLPCVVLPTCAKCHSINEQT